ncbi:MAG: arginyltransferase [Lysobacteraceae bacterium]
MRVYHSVEHACGYYRDRIARDLVLDPHDPALANTYTTALELGFRRSGGHVYRPRCPECRACVPVRLKVRDFRPDRSQRRCLRDNTDIASCMVPAIRTDENFALYRRYLESRHPGGGMSDSDEGDFDQFVASAWSPTRFMQLSHAERLLAVAVTDVLPGALSAVYTFFDPDEQGRGLGTLAILRQIEHARRNGLEFLYLGYWIAGHPKMDYKARFKPLQELDGAGWKDMDSPTPRRQINAAQH